MPSRRLTALLTGLLLLRAVIAPVVEAASSGGSTITEHTTGTTAEAGPISLATPTALVARAPKTVVSLAATPLLVIDPLAVPRYGSIGVWGVGFPGGATVYIYLKERASDQVSPVKVIEADDRGQFNGVTLTVPDSVPRGSLIIQATEYQGSVTAMATATVLDSMDESQAVVQTPPKPLPTPTTPPSPQLQASANAEPADQPTHSPEPQPTRHSKPSGKQQPTSQPQPKTDTSDISRTPSGYIVQPGDNLSAIAEHVYGNANEWRALYQANRAAIGSNPNLIYPGTELVLPPYG